METRYIIKHEIIPKIVKLLKSTSFVVVSQAVRALGTTIEGRPYARDLALEHNALSYLIDLIKSDIRVSINNVFSNIF